MKHLRSCSATLGTSHQTREPWNLHVTGELGLCKAKFLYFQAVSSHGRAWDRIAAFVQPTSLKRKSGEQSSMFLLADEKKTSSLVLWVCHAAPPPTPHPQSVSPTAELYRGSRPQPFVFRRGAFGGFSPSVLKCGAAQFKEPFMFVPRIRLH
jgi:hypothetical protein